MAVITVRESIGNKSFAWVGQIQQVGELGLRITLLDWFVGAFVGADYWFPWGQILGIEIYTDKHDWSHVDFGKTQTRINTEMLAIREAREIATKVDAVDPSASDPGKRTTRDE